VLAVEFDVVAGPADGASQVDVDGDVVSVELERAER
jgi:hypothetical protein